MPILFLKASGAPRKFANMPGYVKIKGHWVRANKEMKAPAGAPKAAHPLAHAKGKNYEMPAEHAQKLMYPEEKAAANHEMKNFNQKHVPNLLAHAKEGDVTAILGHKYGTNTHAKKLVAIANHLLEQMGSSHKVSLGQQAGAHEAISKHPGHEGEPTPAEAQKTPQEAAGEPEQAQAAEAVDKVAEAIQEPIQEPIHEKAETQTGSGLEVPAFLSGKQSKGVRTAYEQHAQKILDAVAAKDVNALQALVNPNAGAWKGKTANSKMLLGLYGQALAKLQRAGEKVTPSTDEPSAVAAVETLVQVPEKPQTQVKPKGVTDMDWDSYKTPDNIKSSKGYNQQLDAVKKAAEAGDVYAILAAKYGTNTYAKKIVAAANLALSKLGYPDVKVVQGKDAVHPMLENLPQPTQEATEGQEVKAEIQAAADKGPQEGDQRMGKSGVMLVFHNGRWHKQGDDQPVPEAESHPVFKTGGEVSVYDMMGLPKGTIVQTYTKEGKPFKKFMVGHGHGWVVNAQGKVLKQPMQKGQFLQLMGIEHPKSSGGYINGYHAEEHPTTIDTLGADDWMSPAMQASIKVMYPGTTALSHYGVYPLSDGSLTLVADLKNPSKGFAVDEMGQWYIMANVTNGYNDPVYQKVMAGIDPGNDKSAAMGLLSEAGEELEESPSHPSGTIDAKLGMVQYHIEKGDLKSADHYIMETAELLKGEPAAQETLDAMQWLVKAKAKVHELAQVAKPDIPPAPAPEIKPAKMTQLPTFKDTAEFDEWSNKHADKWADEGITHYGSEEAFGASPEAKAYDQWAEKSTKAKERKALAQKAKEAAENHVISGLVDKADYETYFNQVTWEDFLSNDLNAAKRHAKEFLKKYNYSDDAVASAKLPFEEIKAQGDDSIFQQLPAFIDDWAESHKKGPQEGDTRQGKNGLQKLINGHWVNVFSEQPVSKAPKLSDFPIPEVVTSLWGDEIQSIRDAIAKKEIVLMQSIKSGLDGLQGIDLYNELLDYANAGLAYLTENANKDVGALIHDAGSNSSGMKAKYENILKIAQQTNTPEAWQEAVNWFNDKGWYTMSKNMASQAIQHLGLPEGYPPLPNTLELNAPSWLAPLYAAIGAAHYLPRKEALAYIQGDIKDFGTDPTPASSHVVDYLAQLAGKLTGKPVEQKEDDSLFDQLVNTNTAELPAKPDGLPKGWVKEADIMEKLVKDEDSHYAIDNLTSMINQLHNLQGPGPKALTDYAQAGIAYHEAKLGTKKPAATEPAQEPVEEGAHEGDMKPGKDGMLILKNGHWVKMGVNDITKPVFTGEKAQVLNNGINNMLNAFDTHPGEGLPEGVKITEHKTGAKAGMMSLKVGVKKYIVSLNSDKPDFKAMAHYLKDVKDFVAKKAKKAKKTQAESQSGAQNPQAMNHSHADGKIDYDSLPDVSGWKVVGGQLGSNQGEQLEDEAGQKWYVKYPKDEQHAQSEVLAASLYAAMGMKAQDAQLVFKNGKMGIASRWENGLTQASPSELANAPGTLDGFLVDVWLGNRDVIGMGYDNLKLDADGNAVRVDAGASLFYRAQGQKKEFTGDPVELTSMLDSSINPQTASVFSKMTDADYMAAAAKLDAIPDAKIRIIVNNMGPGSKAERKKLADILIARKHAIMAKYPADKFGKPMMAKDPSKLAVDPDRLPKQHDFANWNGQGNGLSSKAHLNAANQNVEAQMLKIAETGNLTELKDFQFDVIDPATGNPTGEKKPIAQYPSKHVSAYHADLVAILDEIANPPVALKLFHEIDVDSVHELDAAFPTKKFGTTVTSVAAQEKLGQWVALGRMAKKDLAKVVPKKFMSYSADAVQAAYGKYKSFGKLAKAFINGIQASGSYNDLFREGKEKDFEGNDLKEVAKAALAASTEQPAGTTLTRWQNMPPDMIKKIMATEDGTVFTTVGSMCTSYSPTATSHFGPHRITIRYAEGARAVESFGSGSFASEKEVTTLPGSRFVIISKQKNASGNLELELLMLPPDLGID
ncbi:hypothetical protein ZL58_14195 [Salmonella enterica subsp. enterica serovar Typhimurium]|nr:hypothetical protein [Salmonella enterica subsp. enterica serovar Typhimurium]